MACINVERRLHRLAAGILAILLVASLRASSGLQKTAASNASTPPSVGTGVLTGRVVDADTGGPIAGALVVLSRAPLSNGVYPPQSDITVTIALAGGTTTSLKGSTPNVAPLEMLADDDGRFAFTGLPRGSFSFSVTASGYAGGGLRQRRPGGVAQSTDLADGQRVDDVTLRVWKLATITGRVVDEVGEPVVGALVRVLRHMMVGNQAVFQLVNAGKPTDDRGVYRASGLVPGDYVVAVPTTQTTLPMAVVDGLPPAGNVPVAGHGLINPPSAPTLTDVGAKVGDFLLPAAQIRGARSAVGPAPTEDGRLAAYQTVFYPSATASSQATIITLGSGEEKSGIDVQLTLVTTRRVSGIVTGPDGPAANVALDLLMMDADQTADTAPDDVANTLSDPHGAFTLLAVPSGGYVIRTVTRGGGVGRGGGGMRGGAPPSMGAGSMLWANVPVAVSDADMTGVAVVLRPGLHVSGRLEFKGAAERPTPAQLPGSAIMLQPTTGRAVGPAAQPMFVVSPDGAFTFTGCVPGRYFVRASGWGGFPWIPTAITVGGQDFSDVPLTVDTSDLTDVLITFTDQPAQIAGTVRTPSGSADTKALVVMFPTTDQSWPWIAASRGVHAASAHVTATGTFTLASLPAGDYYLAAVPEEFGTPQGQSTADWQDPKILRSLAATAARVHLAEGEHRIQDLQTSVIR